VLLGHARLDNTAFYTRVATRTMPTVNSPLDWLTALDGRTRPAEPLSRYTHRVAISNSRLLRFDKTVVTFRFKDYRVGGADRQQMMTLSADEFMRRFLLHVLPKGSHRIRQYGLLAGATSKAHLEQARELLGVARAPVDDAPIEPSDTRHHVHAAAVTWSLSRPSRAIVRRACHRHQRRHPGDQRRDPARLDTGLLRDDDAAWTRRPRACRADGP
jgi:hypothetical protein